MGTPNEPTIDEHITNITRIASRDVRNNYNQILRWQNELKSEITALLIKRVEPLFNKMLSEMPQATLAEKQAFCRWANHELRDNLHLAIRCPKTGGFSILHAGAGHNKAVGCFRSPSLAITSERFLRSRFHTWSW